MMASNSSLNRRARQLQSELGIPLSEAKRRVIESDKRRVTEIIPEGHPLHGLPFTSLRDLMDNVVMSTNSPLVISFGGYGDGKTTRSLDWAIAQLKAVPAGSIELFLGLEPYQVQRLSIPEQYQRYVTTWRTRDEGALPDSVIYEFSRPSNMVRILVIPEPLRTLDDKHIEEIKRWVRIGNVARRYIVVEEHPARRKPSSLPLTQNLSDLDLIPSGNLDALITFRAPSGLSPKLTKLGAALNEVSRYTYPMVIDLEPEQAKVLANELWQFADEDALREARQRVEMSTGPLAYYATKATEARVKFKLTIADSGVREYLGVMVWAKGWINTDSETRRVLQPVIDQIMEGVDTE